MNAPLHEFEKAVLSDIESFELSHFDDDNSIRSTYKIPSDQDVEKRNTTVIERLFIDDLIKQGGPR
jgi:hypothetical protein